MLYDNSLDDDHVLFEDPPCRKIVTILWEDKNDNIVCHNDSLIHESHILFF